MGLRRGRLIFGVALALPLGYPDHLILDERGLAAIRTRRRTNAGPARLSDGTRSAAAARVAARILGIAVELVAYLNADRAVRTHAREARDQRAAEREPDRKEDRDDGVHSHRKVRETCQCLA